MSIASVPITWVELGAAIAALSAAGSVVVGIVIWLWSKFNAQERALADFKVKAAETFVTDKMLIRIEEKLTSSIDRLTDKLERALDRFGQRTGCS